MSVLLIYISFQYCGMLIKYVCINVYTNCNVWRSIPKFQTGLWNKLKYFSIIGLQTVLKHASKIKKMLKIKKFKKIIIIPVNALWLGLCG